MDEARERMLDVAHAYEKAFERRAYYATGKEGQKVEELDSRALANLRRRQWWIPIGQLQTDDEDEELRRTEVVPVSRRMARWNPLAKRIIATWTDYGHGQTIAITPEDDAVQKWWHEFWTATRNRPILGIRNVHERSNETLTDGEFFFVNFTDKSNGRVTVRTLDTLSITDFIHLPGDDQTILYYRRQWSDDAGQDHTLYYPDWLATEEQLEQANLPDDAELAQAQDDAIDVDVMQVAAMKSGTQRGWPLMAASTDYTRAYCDFLQNRAAVSSAAATYLDRVRVDGGSRAVSAVKQLLQSSLVDNPDDWETNPPPAAGSMAITNKAVSWDRFNMATGASDAEIDGRMLFNMVGIGAGLFPHWLGMGEAFRLATATSMEGPLLRGFARYQLFWKSVWQDLFDHVLAMAEKYGSQTFENKTVEIALDPLLQTDLTELATALGDLSGVEAVTLPARETTRLALQALKIEDVEEVIAKLFPEDADGQERAAVKVADLAAMYELLKEAAASSNGNGEALQMAGEAFLEALR